MTHKKIAVIDFETATKENNSACSMGICVIENITITEKRYFLIKPPGNKYDPASTGIHGLDAKCTEHMPPFSEIWPNISHYFNGDYVVAAHNAQFDMSVLHCCLKYYEIPIPEFAYIDTMSLCVLIAKPGDKRNLRSLAESIGFKFNDSIHNSCEDAEACANVILACYHATIINETSMREKMFSHLKVNSRLIIKNDFKPIVSIPESINRYPEPIKRYHEPIAPLAKAMANSIDYSKIVKPNNINEDFPLYDNEVVLTGSFRGYSKTELAQKLTNYGATIKEYVSNSTDILIIGMQDKSIVGEDGMSKKEERAAELINQGHNIRRIYYFELDGFLSELSDMVNASKIGIQPRPEMV